MLGPCKPKVKGIDESLPPNEASTLLATLPNGPNKSDLKDDNKRRERERERVLDDEGIDDIN